MERLRLQATSEDIQSKPLAQARTPRTHQKEDSLNKGHRQGQHQDGISSISGWIQDTPQKLASPWALNKYFKIKKNKYFKKSLHLSLALNNNNNIKNKQTKKPTTDSIIRITMTSLLMYKIMLICIAGMKTISDVLTSHS